MCVARQLGSKSWCILDVYLDTGFLSSDCKWSCFVSCISVHCTHVQGDGMHPLWLQQSACGFRCPAAKESMEFCSICVYKVGAALVTSWPRDTSSGEQWLSSTVLCDSLPAPLSFGTLVLVIKTSCSGAPLLHEANKQSRYDLVVTCFVGINLGPASYRRVVLGGAGLAWNCGCWERASKHRLIWKL